MSLLSISNLSLSFPGSDGKKLKALRGISFSVEEGETHALVGESGCGKSLTALAILRILPLTASIDGGEIIFNSKSISTLSQAEMRSIRGGSISMIFQDPLNSLNPVYRSGDPILESLMLHRGMSRRDAEREAVKLLGEVGIPEPEKRVKQYPHELSGGMRQRVMIATAIASRPKLLIADEPTTALDVTVQAQVLDLLKSLQERYGMSILFITHDLGVVKELAESLSVLYSGRVVEQGSVARVFSSPRHPYTKGLQDAVPGLRASGEPLLPIPGRVPELSESLSGCRFSPRCSCAKEICFVDSPELVSDSNGAYECFFPVEV